MHQLSATVEQGICCTLHWPLMQNLACCGHTTPQAPQFNGSLVRSTSQPSLTFMLQSPQPCTQAPSTHLPPMQTVDWFFTGMHTEPHPPQLAESVSAFTSQPLGTFM